MFNSNFLKFLGTGATFPTKYRNGSGIYFKYKNLKIMLDFGEGSQQLAKYGLDFHIDSILMTHNHLDHYWGLIPFLRTLDLRNRIKPLFVLGKNIAEIETHFQRVVIDYLSMSSYQTIFLEFNNPINIDNVQITPVLMKHSIPCIGFLIQIFERERISNKKRLENHLMPGKWCSEILIKKEIEINGQKVFLKEILENKSKEIRIFYSGDTLPIFNNTLFNHLDLMIYECTNCDEDVIVSKKRKHTILSDKLKLQKTYLPKQLILTHISEKLDYTLRNTNLPQFIQIAKDGLTMEIK